MTQDIITFMLIAMAAGTMFFNLYRMVVPLKKKNAPHCAGCTGCQIKKM